MRTGPNTEERVVSLRLAHHCILIFDVLDFRMRILERNTRRETTVPPNSKQSWPVLSVHHKGLQILIDFCPTRS